MNHHCVPNIRYAYSKNSVMAVRASRKILKGEQIFNSYTKFLWGTQQRRVHLAYSKNFLCKCERCVDPTEFESLISALKCVRPGCDSVMLPQDPLVVTSLWECQKCQLRLDHGRISKICDIFSKQIFNKILNEPMSAINHYLRTKLSTILPDSNQFTIEVKLQIILKMKRDQNYVMTLEDYEDIERYCYDVLGTIDRLKCGECFRQGPSVSWAINSESEISWTQGSGVWRRKLSFQEGSSNLRFFITLYFFPFPSPAFLLFFFPFCNAKFTRKSHSNDSFNFWSAFSSTTSFCHCKYVKHFFNDAFLLHWNCFLVLLYYYDSFHFTVCFPLFVAFFHFVTEKKAFKSFYFKIFLLKRLKEFYIIIKHEGFL